MADVCCPVCRSEEIRIIGAVLVSPEGEPYRPGLHLKDMDPSQIHLTREFLRCEECKEQFQLSVAQKAAGMEVEEVVWEVTERGVRVPIICPKCHNQKHFVRTVLELVRKDEDVLVEKGEAEVQFVGGDVVVDHRAILTYACGKAECDGQISLFTNDFHIVHTP